MFKLYGGTICKRPTTSEMCVTANLNGKLKKSRIRRVRQAMPGYSLINCYASHCSSSAIIAISCSTADCLANINNNSIKCRSGSRSLQRFDSCKLIFLLLAANAIQSNTKIQTKQQQQQQKHQTTMQFIMLSNVCYKFLHSLTSTGWHSNYSSGQNKLLNVTFRPTYTHTNTHIYNYIYYICVCVYIFALWFLPIIAAKRSNYQLRCQAHFIFYVSLHRNAKNANNNNKMSEIKNIAR